MYWIGLQLCILIRPGACRIFEEYSLHMFLPYISSQLEIVSRVGIVWDRYLTHSLEQSTRDRRKHSCTTQRQRVVAGAPIPAKWEAFPRKDELFRYLFRYLSILHNRLAKLAEKLSSAQRMKRTSPHIIAGETSSISNHDPIRRQICSAPCCTTRTSQSSIPNRIGCPCTRAFPGASA